MEIARLEVSMQRHIDRMQKTVKVNYVQYGRNKKPKPKPGKFQQPTANGSSSGSSGNPSKSGGKGKKVTLPTDICSGTLLDLVEKVRKFHYLQTFAGDVVKVDTRKDSHVKLWKQCAGTVPSKDTLRKSA